MLTSPDVQESVQIDAPVPGPAVPDRRAPTHDRRLARTAGVHLAMVMVVALAAIGELSGLRVPFAMSQLRPPPAPAPAPPDPRVQYVLPEGKGMWIWQPRASEGGDVNVIVAKAKSVGLTHLYVRTGSSWDGFYGGPFLDRILPVAHGAGLRVYAWDFPRLIDVGADVGRAVAAVSHHAPGGHQVDGFAADIETRSEGVNIGPGPAHAYGSALRQAMGPGVPLIAVVPSPVYALGHYPYPEVTGAFDAVSPMVYWMATEPGEHTKSAMTTLAALGKPVLPIGQAYDGGPEGGPHGVPPPEQLWRFMDVAADFGAPAVSFWSWQAADQRAWEAIRDARSFPAPG